MKHPFQYDTWTRAALAIAARTEATPAYRAAFALAVERSATVFVSWQTVEDARRDGGRTAVTRREIEAAIAATPGCGAPTGSTLTPTTPASHLRLQVYKVLDAAQTQESRIRHPR